MATQAQIERWMHMFCEMGTRDGIVATGDIQYRIVNTNCAEWQASFFGREVATGALADIIASACNVSGTSPSVALANAYTAYSDDLDAYLDKGE